MNAPRVGEWRLTGGPGERGVARGDHVARWQWERGRWLPGEGALALNFRVSRPVRRRGGRAGLMDKVFRLT